MPATATRAKLADGLTFLQLAFCREYIKDHNGKRAAVRAGYAEIGAKVTACRTLTKSNVKAEIARLTAITETTDAEKETNARTVILADTVKMYDAAVTARNLTAAASLLQLRSRQHGMLSDKIVHEDVKAIEIAENKARLYRELAQAHIRRKYLPSVTSDMPKGRLIADCTKEELAGLAQLPSTPKPEAPVIEGDD